MKPIVTIDREVNDEIALECRLTLKADDINDIYIEATHIDNEEKYTPMKRERFYSAVEEIIDAIEVKIY